MNWNAFGAIVAAFSVFLTGINVLLVLQIKLAIAVLRADIERMRNEDRNKQAETYQTRDLAANQFAEVDRRLRGLERASEN